MRNLRRLRRNNPWAFWLTTGGLGLMILIASGTILFMVPEIRVLWHLYWGQDYYEKAQEDNSFYQKSLEEFDKAIRMSTNYDWMALVGRGTIQGKLNKPQEQLNDCKRATEENEEFALAWNCLGVALNILGKNKQKEEQYEAAKTNFEQAIAAFDQAIYWAQKNEALGSTKERVEVEIEATYNKGETFLNNKEPEEAIATLQKAVELAENNQVKKFDRFLYNLLATAYREKKDYEKALNFYNRSIFQKQDYYPAQFGKGLTLYYQEKYQEALEVFDQILGNQNRYKLNDFQRTEVSKYKRLTEEAIKNKPN